MDFLNRSAESARLQTALSRVGRQFIVVYGRRRCGKSTLLRHVARERDVYFLANQADAALQRSLLAGALERKHPGFALGTYPDWTTFFRALVARGGERYTLLIDEFPYLQEGDRSLASTLQHLLEDRSALPFDLILCGSSQQLMERAVLAASAPLYGRADEILHLQPLEAGYLAEAFPQNDPVQNVTEFAVWGGVPRYWQLRERYGDLASAVRDLLLSPTGLLRDEPRRLLLDDLSELATPLSLLALVAGGSHRVIEIGARLGKTSADLTRPLARLVSLGYVAKETPYGDSGRHSKRTYYRVADPFMRFYHRYLLPNASRVEMGQGETVWTEIESTLPLFVSDTWELLCRRAIARGALGTEFSDCRRWWGNTTAGRAAEIDGVARSRDGEQLLLLEAKWSDAVDVEREVERLRVLAPDLPFYKGEELVVCLSAKRPFAGSGRVASLDPARVLATLR